VEQSLLLPEHVIRVQASDIVGMEGVLKEIAKMIRLSILAHHIRRESVVAQSRGLLLYGPPGTGKTTVAKVWSIWRACATRGEARLIFREVPLW
jgi:ATP-dependent 26S proteasome regulatory subunit